MLDLEGNSFVRIENFIAIQEFTEQKLSLKANGTSYELMGKRLRIKEVTNREIFVEGELEALRIIKEAE